MEITIADVVNLLGIERLPRRATENSFPIVCPYCGDRRGKNTVRIEKNGRAANVFHCWACGKGGTMLDLYIDGKAGYTGQDRYKKAWRDLNQAFGNAGYEPRYARELPEKVPHVKKAPVEELDRTYRAMLGFLALKKQDRADLVRRSLADAEIRAGLFASTPYDTTGICRKLLKAGCVLEGVPGFFMNADNEWQLNVFRNAGYFCPVFQEGRIAGMQIRLRNPFDGQKYIWLSSADKPHGVSSGAPCTFIGCAEAEKVVIVEGTLKTFVTYCLMADKNTALAGVPGVSCINDLVPLLKRHSHKVVYEAYDMDKNMDIRCMKDYDAEKCTECAGNHYCHFRDGICQKKLVKAQMLHKSLENLESKVKQCGFESLNHYHWDRGTDGIWLGNYKGIDDFLAGERRNYGQLCSAAC
ncbi:MAG: hypothetical protein LUE14_12380 [Clostridiales bacterium]|nr:hypothetical protein [Clostridiales bacterium]